MSPAALVLISRPYRSLGPQGYRRLFRIVIGANLVGAVVIAIIGAWPVLPFLGLDIVALYLAFHASYRQSRAFERISIDASDVNVVWGEANGAELCARLPSYWAQVVFDGDGEGGTITLRSHGHEIEIGRFLPGPERIFFVETLRRALADIKSVR